jgi:FK506-binding nuclear protein
VVPQDEEEDDDEEYSDDEYDLPPGLDEEDSDAMSDELDGIDTISRIKEIDTDEEEAPKLVQSKKGKKRAAEEEAEGLDEMMAKDEKKLSKKQQKKLKNNQGEPVAAEDKTKESPAAKGDKKSVQFAKNLEQGPTGPAKDKAEKKDEKKGALGVKVVQGVTIDDRKAGSGRTVKSGDRVGMRYIGKLQNGKVFDCK